MREFWALPLFIAASSPLAAAPVEPGRPATDPAQWISMDDYPASALREGTEGVVSFVLTYDAQGAVTECTIAQSSRSAALDETTCRAMRARARFAPGKDDDGKNVGGTYSSRVRWVIPVGAWDAATVFNMPTTVTTVLVEVSEQGVVEDCKVSNVGPRAENTRALGDQFCSSYPVGRKLDLLSDGSKGVPYRIKQEMTFQIQPR